MAVKVLQRTCYPRKTVDDWIADSDDKDSVISTYGPMKDWDMSAVTDMQSMFDYASAFNGELSKWDTGEVTNMQTMFYGAFAFNGDLSKVFIVSIH